MRRMGLVGALALVVLVNGVVLGGVAWNRSGTPDATLVLTERELQMRYSIFPDREDSGVALLLILAQAMRSPPWLDEAKLRELGFAPQRGRGSGDGGSEYRKHPLPRRAFVVLELDGPAWAALVQEKEQEVAQMPAQIEAGKRNEQQLAQARQALERMRESGSRLVPVDAGIDPEALRARYPDRRRYAVMPAEIRMGYAGRGFIARILTGSIHVPVQFHEELQAATGSAPARDPRPWPGARYARNGPPRYQVTLHVGRRYEPWIGDVKQKMGSEVHGKDSHLEDGAR